MRFFLGHFIVEGESMRPDFEPGDHVITWNLSKGRPGDVIVCKKNAKTMIKRIRSIEKGRYFVEGDNGRKSTGSEWFGEVKRSQIIGKVIARIRGNRTPRNKS